MHYQIILCWNGNGKPTIIYWRKCRHSVEYSLLGQEFINTQKLYNTKKFHVFIIYIRACELFTHNYSNLMENQNWENQVVGGGGREQMYIYVHTDTVYTYILLYLLNLITQSRIRAMDAIDIDLLNFSGKFCGKFSFKNIIYSF